MPVTANASRASLWLESLGDWHWPGRTAHSEVLPPAWIPAEPPRLELSLAGAAPAAAVRPHTRLRPWRVFFTGLASALLAICCALALNGSLTLNDVLGEHATPAPAPQLARAPASALALPPLQRLSGDRAGSSIDRVSFHSADLGARGAFLVYLPPDYATSSALRYPVLYLLHGRDGHASAFVEIGIQHTLDTMIEHGAIAPLIAIMIQDQPTLQNWRDVGQRHSASYVVEVQRLVDRMFRTVPARAARAIAGSSMGGYGAMHVALANPYTFSVVESWLGFFDGLEGELRADAPVISRLGLHAFLYGAEADPVAVPEEDPLFAAQLSAAGAQAEGVVYPGGHSLGKVREHLATGLQFASRSLAAARSREDIEEAHARWRG
ncbi:MAG TPA: alpha/beta hydrolase-fold protein [Solirubrobacteraceae bacterium]|jgi:enterochelin esterase-like enzyme|nr:alpha/beta hydrolase-fold protein [Solirubrobacteraceae bacterium]